MKTICIASILLLISSCVMPGDLRDLADTFEDYQEGAITHPELTVAIEAKADEIEERTQVLVESMPATPAGWLALLAQLGATAAVGGIGVNRYRDKKRVARGEPTSPKPPMGPA